jgi:hypothetical protein
MLSGSEACHSGRLSGGDARSDGMINNRMNGGFSRGRLSLLEKKLNPNYFGSSQASRRSLRDPLLVRSEAIDVQQQQGPGVARGHGQLRSGFIKSDTELRG